MGWITGLLLVAAIPVSITLIECVATPKSEHHWLLDRMARSFWFRSLMVAATVCMIALAGFQVGHYHGSQSNSSDTASSGDYQVLGDHPGDQRKAFPRNMLTRGHSKLDKKTLHGSLVDVEAVVAYEGNRGRGLAALDYFYEGAANLNCEIS